jgi:hypothetical protein
MAHMQARVYCGHGNNPTNELLRPLTPAPPPQILLSSLAILTTRTEASPATGFGLVKSSQMGCSHFVSSYSQSMGLISVAYKHEGVQNI